MSKKFKLLISLFICLIALFPTSVKAAETTHVKDYLNYLSETELQELQSKISEVSKKYSLDTVIVITDNTDGKSSKKYSEDFYDNNNYGIDEKQSGILMLINMNAREIYLCTKGKAITAFTNSNLQSMITDIKKYLSEGNYYGASSKFLEKVNYYCDKNLVPNTIGSNSTENIPSDSTPDSGENAGSESDSATETTPTPTSYFSRLKDKVSDPTTYMFSLIIAVIVTVVVTKKSKWKVTVDSKTYEESGSFRVTNREDIFISENTDRTWIERRSTVNNNRNNSSSYRNRNNNSTYNTTNNNSYYSNSNNNSTYKRDNENTYGGAGGSFGDTHGGAGGSF